MLKELLKSASQTLDALISQTYEDIENIKKANHIAVNESVAKKTRLIKEFENTKKSIDAELVALASSGGASSLGERLDDESRESLAHMRTQLEMLHKVNKEYARHVVAVKEFFDTLVGQMFGSNDESGVYKARA